jgi:hypothetical protein
VSRKDTLFEMKGAVMTHRFSKIVSSALVGLVLLAPMAQAGRRTPKKVSRTESYDYVGLGGAEAQGSDFVACIENNGCLTLSPSLGESYITVDVEDASGTPAPIQVDVNGGQTVYCGTSSPIFTNGASEVDVTILAASASCTGVGTSGTLNATFSNRP